jgi:hypothetical protein
MKNLKIYILRFDVELLVECHLILLVVHYLSRLDKPKIQIIKYFC